MQRNSPDPGEIRPVAILTWILHCLIEHLVYLDDIGGSNYADLITMIRTSIGFNKNIDCNKQFVILG